MTRMTARPAKLFVLCAILLAQAACNEFKVPIPKDIKPAVDTYRLSSLPFPT